MIRMDAGSQKKMLSEPKRARAWFFIGPKRCELKVLVAVITGHGPFGHQLLKMGVVQQSICTSCLEEEDETGKHFLRFCLE